MLISNIIGQLLGVAGGLGRGVLVTGTDSPVREKKKICPIVNNLNSVHSKITIISYSEVAL